MKAVLNRKKLSDSLDKIVTVIQNKTTIPILSNIKFEFDKENKNVSLTATNLEMTANCIIDCEVDCDWITTIPARKLQSLVNKFKKDEIIFEMKGVQIQISNGSAVFLLNTLDSKEFPDTDQMEFENNFELEGSKIKNALDSVISSISIDESRKVITGVHMSIKNGTVEFNGTDGKRLSTAFFYYDSEKQADLILPVKYVNELRHSIEDKTTICLNDKHIKVISGFYKLTGKLIEGSYPNVAQVIPKSFKNTLKIDTNATLNVLDMVSLLVSNGEESINFEVSNGKVKISANGKDGAGSDEIEVFEYAGEDINFSCKPQFMLDAIKCCDSETFELRFNDEISPVGFYSENKFSIIMPMRKK